MIKKNALMGCALHEEMIRNKLNQISPYSSENVCSPPFASPTVPSTEINQMTSDEASKLMFPFVKLQRNSIIDGMAENYAQKQNNVNIPLTSMFKRKRSH